MLHEVIAMVAGYVAITILAVLYIESVMKSYVASSHPLIKRVGELYSENSHKWPIWVVGLLWLPLLPLIIIVRATLLFFVIFKK